MAHQAPWRDAVLVENSHAIRVRNDGLAADPNATPDERAHRIARLTSPLLAQDYTRQCTDSEAVWQEALAADPNGEDQKTLRHGWAK
jgi:hypothetical protein